LTNGDLAITVNKTTGDQVNNWSGYLNIFVRPNLGFLGEAPLGGSGNGDGVLIDASTFGLGAGCGNVRPQAPFNLGRTTTHEVGHYLLLDHIWGDGCGQDDGVSDTPAQASDNSGCPSFGIKSCNSNDMHMNYMDYTNDACMYMFSNGQAQRMVAYINSSLTSMKNKASLVCEEGNGGSGDNNSEDEDDTTENDNTNETPDGTCSKVSGSSVVINSTSSATVNWPSIAGAFRYRLRYRQQGTRTWTGLYVDDAQYTITGLSANRIYEYQIRARCASGWTPLCAIQTFEMTADSSEDNDGNNNGGNDTNSSCNNNEITFRVKLDDYGSETSWELLNEGGDRLDSGGPFEDGQNGKVITEEFCLPNGCYTMYIDDAYGDGICCSEGNGKVRIRDGAGSLIASSNGDFGYFTNLDFCVTNGSARFMRERKDMPNKTVLRAKRKS
jgi:hypothetical protein